MSERCGGGAGAFENAEGGFVRSKDAVGSAVAVISGRRHGKGCVH